MSPCWNEVGYLNFQEIVTWYITLNCPLFPEQDSFRWDKDEVSLVMTLSEQKQQQQVTWNNLLLSTKINYFSCCSVFLTLSSKRRRKVLVGHFFFFFVVHPKLERSVLVRGFWGFMASRRWRCLPQQPCWMSESHTVEQSCLPHSKQERGRL